MNTEAHNLAEKAEDAPSAKMVACDEQERTLIEFARVAYASLTPRQRARLGCPRGVEVRRSKDRAFSRFRPVIADPRLNGGRRVYLCATKADWLAALLHDVARIALGREPANDTTVGLERFPLALLDEAWCHVIRRLRYHAGPAFSRQLLNLPSPFLKELNGPDTRTHRIH